MTVALLQATPNTVKVTGKRKAVRGSNAGYAIELDLGGTSRSKLAHGEQFTCVSLDDELMDEAGSDALGGMRGGSKDASGGGAVGGGGGDHANSVTTAAVKPTTVTTSSLTVNAAGETVTDACAVEIVTEASPGAEAVITFPVRVEMPPVTSQNAGPTRSVTSTSLMLERPVPPNIATAVASVCW